MNFILTISNFIFPLITFPYVSRVLGASGLGVVNFAISYISYFTMFGMLGIPTYGIRICAKYLDDKEKLTKTVVELIIVNAIVMSLSIAIFLGSVAVIPKLQADKTLYYIMCSTLFFNVLGVEWLYKALEKYSYITIRSIVFKLISILIMFLLVRDSQDYVIYGALTIFASVGSNLMNFWNLRDIIDIKLVRRVNITQHITPIVTFFLISASWTLFSSLDTTLLGFMKSNEQVGYFSVAVRIKQLLASLLASFSAVLLPRLTKFYEKKDHDGFQLLVSKALNFILLLSIPLTIYSICYSKEVIYFISGDGFTKAILPLRLILPSVFFMGISGFAVNQILVPMNHEKVVLRSTLLTCVVNIILNLILIPFIGASGAAFAGSVSEGVLAAVQLYAIRRMLKNIVKTIGLNKIAFATILALVLSELSLSLLGFTSPFIILVVSSFIFFTVYLLVLIGLKEKLVLTTLQTFLMRLLKRNV
ncbi:flippase [Streptococcus saliviloxodontae]|uniref:O-antigen/teichoic acid export membrane protein n=1 Tax=Streptococcus saliviloxodontae TaxID=1349416 RepID=A0ABS2PLL4_9STRE|nr:flippase [Streptococcus saliviloxodontae]MBM7635971.1 O-antigen/teichoic acid export membrane protein [Streptococcus saliviloxodontae]